MKNEKRMAWILQFQEINKLMEDQIEKWHSIREIQKTYDVFVKNLKKLKDLQPDLEKNLAPVQDELKQKQENLIGKIFPVTNILAIYIDDHVNTLTLYKQVSGLLGVGFANLISGEVDGVKRVLGETIAHTGYVIIIFQVFVSKTFENKPAIPSFNFGLDTRIIY